MFRDARQYRDLKDDSSLHTMVDVNACQMAKADRDLQLWSHAQCWRLEVRTCLVMYHDNDAQSSVADSGEFLFLSCDRGRIAYDWLWARLPLTSRHRQTVARNHLHASIKLP